jgi:hypothetical protein
MGSAAGEMPEGVVLLGYCLLPKLCGGLAVQTRQMLLTVGVCWPSLCRGLLLAGAAGSTSDRPGQ